MVRKILLVHFTIWKIYSRPDPAAETMGSLSSAQAVMIMKNLTKSDKFLFQDNSVCFLHAE